METHNRQFFDCVIKFNGVFSYFRIYHNSRVISVEQNGTANKNKWPVTMHKVSEIPTQAHHDMQNLQLNIRSKKSFGALTCSHSSQCHFTAKDKRNAANSATTTTQQTNSVTIRQSMLKFHINNIAIPAGRTGYQNPCLLSVRAHIRYCTGNYGKSIPF